MKRFLGKNSLAMRAYAFPCQNRFSGFGSPQAIEIALSSFTKALLDGLPEARNFIAPLEAWHENVLSSEKERILGAKRKKRSCRRKGGHGFAADSKKHLSLF